MPRNTLLDNREPINADDPSAEHEQLLKNLQGNILKDHGRDFANHIFIKFSAGPDTIRKWIRAFTTKGELKVTSAWQQNEDAHAYKLDKEKNKDKPFVSFLLSAEGYRYLEREGKMPDEKPNSKGGHSFRNGMKTSGETLLHDSPASEWEEQWKTAIPIHALIILANDVLDKLSDDTDRILDAEFAGHKLKDISHSFTESGAMMYQDQDTRKPREHFGYIDGISNPLFLRSEVYMADQESFAPLRLALVSDPGGRPKSSCFGSFLVFRKYEQNVEKFHKQIGQLSAALTPGGNVKRAMALVMGRFPDGTPIAIEAGELTASSRQNTFRYLDEGGRCPFKAHIRRANPRNGIPDSKEHRIVRRGITYGERTLGFDDFPETGRGLLFMCYQSDISNQFEHIQAEWSNWAAARDPIIGQVNPTRNDTPEDINRRREWPREWAKTKDELEDELMDWPANMVLENFEFGQYVKLQGGEYFFAPSIPSLRNL
jgi:Dyp-type peroxidase family